MHLTNGIDDALHLIADTFIEDGDSVLVVEPTFDMYRFFAELAGARVIALRYDEEMRFPVDAVVRELRRPPNAVPARSVYRESEQSDRHFGSARRFAPDS